MKGNLRRITKIFHIRKRLEIYSMYSNIKISDLFVLITHSKWHSERLNWIEINQGSWDTSVCRRFVNLFNFQYIFVFQCVYVLFQEPNSPWKNYPHLITPSVIRVCKIIPLPRPPPQWEHAQWFMCALKFERQIVRSRNLEKNSFPTEGRGLRI